MTTRKGRARSCVLLAVNAALLFTIGTGCTSAADTQPVEASAIIALERQMWEDWKQARYDSMGARMTDDVIIADDVAGIADRASLLAAMKATGCQGSDYTLTNPLVRVLSADVAVIGYDVQTVGVCNGQTSVSSPQVATSVWVRDGDRWLTASHHQNSVGRRDSLARAGPG